MDQDDRASEGDAAKETGNRIRSLREASGWGQKALADKAGIASSQISVWENGASISGASLTNLAKALGTSVRFLRTGEDSKINALLQKDIPDKTYFDDLRGATQLWVTGLNLRRFFPDQTSIIEEICAKDGGRVMAVLLDPNYREGCRYGALQEYGFEDQWEKYQATIELALSVLSRFKSPKLELRCVQYPLSFGLDVLDAETPSGSLYVRFYPLRRRLVAMPEGNGQEKFETCPDQPILKLDDTDPDHKYWYDFYKKQFFTIWKLAADWPR